MGEVFQYASDVAKCIEHFSANGDGAMSAELVAYCVASYWANRHLWSESGCQRSGHDCAFVGVEPRQSCYVRVVGDEARDDFDGGKCGQVSDVCDNDDTGNCVKGDDSSCGVEVRGKHYWKNKAKKASRKNRGQSRKVAVDTALKSHALPGVGFFSACDESIKADLRVSRAKMLIAQNEQRARKALADVDRMNMEKDTRVNEAKFELNRLTVDDKLRKISEARMGGSAQTVISSSITSSPPSLSSGSVSPNSSISVAEEMRLRNAVSSLTLEVEQLKKKQVNEVHDGTFVRREVRGTGVYRVHTEEDEFGYSQWD